MKVLVSCADSGSLKEYSFTKDTDTTDPDTPKPEFQSWLAEKRNPVVKFVQTNQGVVVARQKGSIALYTSGEYEHIRDLVDFPNLVGFDLAGDSLYLVNEEGSGLIYDLETNKTSKFTLPPNLSIAVKHALEDVFLCSGRELRPEIHTLKGQVLFQARNPKAKLDLPEKNLVVNACFISTKNQGDGKHHYKFATVTSHGKLRVYDTEHSKKPISQDQISKFHLKALACHETNLIVGDTQSKVGLYATTNPAQTRLLGNFKGIVGATNSVTIRKDLVCIVGLDRYIRVFNVVTREPHGKVYVGEELEYAIITQDDDEKRALEEDEFWEDISNATKKKKVVKPIDPVDQGVSEQVGEDLSELSEDASDASESLSESDFESEGSEDESQ